MEVTLKGTGDPLEWAVWASLEAPDDEHPVEEMPESFILGAGATPEAACNSALLTLGDAVNAVRGLQRQARGADSSYRRDL